MKYVLVQNWLANKLTGLAKKYRITDYFKIVKETEKAYQVSFINEEEPIGWVAKSLVLEITDNVDSELKKIDRYVTQTLEKCRRLIK